MGDAAATLHVFDGSALPPLGFAVVDAWGNRTAPLAALGAGAGGAAGARGAGKAKGKAKKGKRALPESDEEDDVGGALGEAAPFFDNERWDVVVDLEQGGSGGGGDVSGGLVCATGALSIPVDPSDGTAGFGVLSLRLPPTAWAAASSQSGIPRALALTLTARLRVLSTGGRYATDKDHRGGTEGAGVEPAADVPLAVKPSDKPARVTVFQLLPVQEENDAESAEGGGGEATEARPFVPGPVAVGSSLKDLEVRVFDAFGRALPIYALARRCLGMTDEDGDAGGGGAGKRQVGSDAGAAMPCLRLLQNGEPKGTPVTWQELLGDFELAKKEEASTGGGGGGASVENDLGIMLPDIDLEKKLTAEELRFTVEVSFGPLAGWPALSQDLTVPLTAAPPKKWVLHFGDLPAGLGAAQSPKAGGKSGSGSAPKSVRVGDALAEVLPMVYLVDEFKNRVTDPRWLVLAGSPVVEVRVPKPRPLDAASTAANGDDESGADGADGAVVDGDELVFTVRCKLQRAGTSSSSSANAGAWLLNRAFTLRGATGKLKLSAATSPSVVARLLGDGGGGGGGGDDDKALEVLGRCKAASKSLPLVAGPPVGLALRSASVSGFGAWSSCAVAAGSLAAGYELCV